METGLCQMLNESCVHHLAPACNKCIDLQYMHAVPAVGTAWLVLLCVHKTRQIAGDGQAYLAKMSVTFSPPASTSGL